MNQLSGDEFTVTRIGVDPPDITLPLVVVTYADKSGEAEYTEGLKLETAAGDVIEAETAYLDYLGVSESGRGLGTKLMSRVIEEINKNKLSYVRMSLINPAMSGVIEKVLQQGAIKNRAYRAYRTGDLFDLPSKHILKTRSDLVPEEVEGEMAKIGEAPRVECVIEL